MTDTAIEVRVIVFQEDEKWIAQVLEHDICTQSDNCEALLEELPTIIVAHAQLSTKQGMEPLADISPAPKNFFEMWAKKRQDAGSTRNKVPFKANDREFGLELEVA